MKNLSKKSGFKIGVVAMLTGTAFYCPTACLATTSEIESIAACFQQRPHVAKVRTDLGEKEQFMGANEIAESCTSSAAIWAEAHAREANQLKDLVEVVTRHSDVVNAAKILRIGIEKGDATSYCELKRTIQILDTAFSHSTKGTGDADWIALEGCYGKMKEKFVKDLETKDGNGYIYAHLCPTMMKRKALSEKAEKLCRYSLKKLG